VSARLKGELIHPNRAGVLVGLRFSPDSKRLIAGDYPGGVVVVWDVATGKQLTSIETGYGYRGGTEYFHVAPDWNLVYAAREKRKATRLVKDGKPVMHLDCTGDVRAWDLATGALRETYQHTPPRGMSAMVLSPDGTTFATFEELSGDRDAGLPSASSVWNVKTRQSSPLSHGLDAWSVYSPDCKTLAGAARMPGDLATAIKLFDVSPTKLKLSIPMQEKNVTVGYLLFSPDSKQLVGQVRVEIKNGVNWLKFWDTATGQETASFEAPRNTTFLWMAFSPDGRTLAVSNWREERGKLFLFDTVGKRLVKTLVLAEAAKGNYMFAGEPAFSPDGKWLALTTQEMPPPKRDEVDPLDMEQPRIHLIDVAAGEVRETLIVPQGFPRSACFSPDGRTLATPGHGKVLLWDLTKPPESRQRAQRH
jgi:WD40 repeat protein